MQNSRQRLRLQLFLIMGISSIFLGIYMVFIMVIYPSFKQDYHIGCYLSDHTLNNSQTFRNKLNNIKNKANQNRINDKRIRYNSLINSDIHQKSVNLTNNIETYIQKLIINNHYQKSNMEFFLQLSKTRKQYQDCAYRIKNQFSESDCNNLWEQYLKYSSQYELVKKSLSYLYNNRSILVNKYKNLIMDGKIQEQPTDTYAQQLQKIRLKYIRLNKQNNQKRQNYLSQLKGLQQKRQNQLKQRQKLTVQLNQQRIALQLCSKNVTQFTICQQIAHTLQKYGSQQSMYTTKITKMQTVRKIDSLIAKNKKNNLKITQLTQMKQLIRQQVMEITLLKIQIFFVLQQCGCSRQKIQKHQRNITLILIRLKQLEVSIQTLTFSIQKIKTYLKQCQKKQQRFYLDEQKQKQSIIDAIQPNPLRPDRVKHNYAEQIKLLNQTIFKYQIIFKQFQQKCNKTKNNLMSLFSGIDQITNCLSKKDYYQKLKAKEQKILYKTNQQTQRYKNNIKQLLSGISHQKAILTGSDQFLDIDTEIVHRTIEQFKYAQKQVQQTQKIEEKRSSFQKIEKIQTQQTIVTRQNFKKQRKFDRETQIQIQRLIQSSKKIDHKDLFEDL